VHDAAASRLEDHRASGGDDGWLAQSVKLSPRYVLTGGRERLHLDLRTALHDNGMRAGRAGGTRRWRRHKLRIWDWCFAGNGIWIYELWDHHDFIWVHPAAAQTPAEERLPNEAVRNTDTRSHTVVRRPEGWRHENDARRERANHYDAVAAESVVSVKSVDPVAAMASAPVTPCEDRGGRNDEEHKRYERQCNCSSHTANSAERVDSWTNRVSTGRADPHSRRLRGVGCQGAVGAVVVEEVFKVAEQGHSITLRL
jgi:hypothetical protein